jgi:hypothetical protein
VRYKISRATCRSDLPRERFSPMTLTGSRRLTHSITSSARASSIGGTSRPSILAVPHFLAQTPPAEGRDRIRPGPRAGGLGA